MRAIQLCLFTLVLFGCGGGGGAEEAFRYEPRDLASPAAGQGFGEAVSLGGGAVAVGSPAADAGARDAGVVHVFDAGTGALRRTVESPSASVEGAFGSALDGDAEHLLAGAPGEGRAYLLERSTGRVVFVLERAEPEFGLAAALDGAALWVASRWGVSRFDRDNGALLSHVDLFGVHALAASGGRLLAAHGGGADLIDGAVRRRLAEGPVRAIALDGARAAVSSGGVVRGFDAVTGDPLFARSGRDGYGRALAYAGAHLLVSWTNVLGAAQLDLLDATTGAVETTLAPEDAAGAISVDGGIALLGIAQRAIAQTVNCDTGEFLRQFVSPSGSNGGMFGRSVALVDGRLAVGAPGESGGDGRVHILNADGTRHLSLDPPLTGGQGAFGSSLLVYGGGLAVGAPGDGSGEGRVYLFDSGNGNLIRTYASPAAEPGGEFGFALADQGGNLVVGAPGEGATGSSPGMVHRYDGQGTFLDSFGIPTQDPDGRFGHALAADANEILVGAPNAVTQADSSGTRSGMMFVFDPNQRAVVFSLDSPERETDGMFGAAVAMDGAFYFGGAPGEDEGNDTEAGKVHRFDRQQGGLDGTIRTTNGAPGGNFGFALHVAGTRLAIGAPGEFTSPEGTIQATEPGFQTTPGPGVVHVIELTTGFRDQRYENQDQTPEAGRFGEAVFLAPDALLAGAPAESSGAGRAYLFNLTLRDVVVSPNVQDNGLFGRGMAVFDANRIVVGAPGENQGQGVAYLYDAAAGRIDLTIPNPSGGNDQFGFVVAAWNGRIAVAAPGANNGDGSVFVFDTQGALVDTLTPTATQSGFGASMAVDGAGNLVVGAPSESGGEGAVYRFAPSGALVDVLVNGLTTNPINFGRSVVAIGNDIGIEAPEEASSEGRFYVFDLNGNRRYVLASPSAQNGNFFGYHAASFNGELYVGDPLAGQFGEVQVYDPATGAYRRTIASPAGVQTAGFGYTLQPFGSSLAVTAIVALGGRVAILDANDVMTDLIYSGNPKTVGSFGFHLGDLGGVLVASAPLEDVNPTNAGRVYFAQVAQQQQPPPTGGADLVVSSPNPTASGAFGFSAALSGPNSVVGAPNEDNGEGVAYVLANSSGNLVRTLRSPNAVGGGAFAASVAGNSVMTVVGAPGETTGPDRTGRGYLFDAGTGQLMLVFDTGNPVDGGQFGFSTAVADLNLVIGAPGEDNGAGRAYYFDCGVEDILMEFQSPNATGGGEFGYAVGARDFEVFIGAPSEGDGEGAVYWFHGLTGELLGTFTSPNATSGGRFGHAIAVDGDRLVVGAPGEVDPQGDEFERGRVHVFDLSSSSLERTLSSPFNEDGGLFGSAVAIAGGSLYAGAPGEGQGAGAVHEFDASNGTALDSYASPNPENDGAFGAVLDANGANFLVGAPGEDGGAADSGRAYLNPDALD